MAADTQSIPRILNPFTFQLQKLSVELKCPLCLNLLTNPMLLPCDHMLCKFCLTSSALDKCECPVCQHQYADQEKRAAPRMESMIAIYRSLYTTFNAKASQSQSKSQSHDAGRSLEQSPTSINVDDRSRMAAEIQSIAQILNPLAFDVQKMSLELNCSLCLNLLTNPILLPCDHILCKLCVPRLTSCECPVCQFHYANQEITAAPYMESMIEIYRSLNAIFNDKASQSQSGSHSHDAGRSLEPSPTSVDIEDRSSSGQSAKVVNNIDLNKEINQENGQVIIVALTAPNKRVREEGAVHEMDVKRKKKRRDRLSKNSLDAPFPNKKRDSCSEKVADKQKVVMDEHLLNGSSCSFCHSSKITEGTGQMLYYKNGKEVVGDVTSVSKVISVHSKCVDWVPQLYDDGDTIKNLDSELARAAKLKCSVCGRKGAALGCLEKSCERSYHLPCALEIQDCRWDTDNLLMLCPSHKSIKFPSEKSKSGKRVSRKVCPASAPLNIEAIIPSMSLECETSKQSRFWATSSDGPKEWVLSGQHLQNEEKSMLLKFAEMCGATVCKSWQSDVTHVIAATNEKGACTRTFKFLRAILNGKWILTVDWIRACIEANGPVNEEPYEISLDNYDVVGAPKVGRFKASTNAPKLFDGYNFYLIGEYKCDLFDLVKDGGGVIIETKESLEWNFVTKDAGSSFLVVYKCDVESGEESNILVQRRAKAKRLAKRIGCQVIPHSWILESIATYQLVPL